MSLIKKTENYLCDVINACGYEVEIVKLEKSKMPEYGQYQINIAMQLAKKYSTSPQEIASRIVDSLDNRFTNVNIQGPGFINVSFSDEVLLTELNEGIEDFNIFVDHTENPKTIVLDYGGANIAKELHVGHLRCNIGEAVRRIITLFGDKAISDVHWGDWGTPLGLVIREIQEMYPDLPYFDVSYEGEYSKTSPVTNEELGVIYPRASKRKKEDEVYANEAKLLTERLQKGERGIRALWQHIVNVSKEDSKRVYDFLNCSFDYSYGESDADPYVEPVLDFFKEKGVTQLSEGALIMHVKEECDTKEMPPLMFVRSDGAVSYATTDLATIMQRMQDFKPDGIWYFVDERQNLHFEQVFRGAKKSGLVPGTMDFRFLGFGTINGPDGKPFKTRDGGIMSLKELIKLVRDKIEPKIKEDIVGKEREDVANKLTVATLKYSDLLPSRKTDYIFDVDKFTSFEGKTGIYIVYTTMRIHSLLTKLGRKESLACIPNNETRDILVKLTELPKVLTSAYQEITTNYICEYLYELCSIYNKFYANYNIAKEECMEIQSTYIALSQLVYNTLRHLLNLLGIEEVEKM